MIIAKKPAEPDQQELAGVPDKPWRLIGELREQLRIAQSNARHYRGRYDAVSSQVFSGNADTPKLTAFMERVLNEWEERGRTIHALQRVLRRKDRQIDRLRQRVEYHLDEIAAWEAWYLAQDQNTPPPTTYWLERAEILSRVTPSKGNPSWPFTGPRMGGASAAPEES